MRDPVEPAAFIRDYFTAFEGFDLADTMARDLSGDAQALNACIECCDRHAQPGRVALVWESSDGSRSRHTFVELREQSARFASALASLGVGPGDRVSGLLPRTPELLIAVLATWRLGAVYQPLFTAFGPKAIEHRVRTAGSKVLVTNAANRDKLDGLEVSLQVVTVADADGKGVRPGDHDFRAELARHEPRYEALPRRADDPFLLMFTSGTTGLAKPLEVPLKAITAFMAYMRDAVDLRPDDTFWNLADPGWAYGLYYGVTGPLALGHAITFYDGPFSVESTARIVQRYGIDNLAGSPTAFRLLMAAGDTAVDALAGRLRVVSSAGEPLTPEVIRWFADRLGAPIHDHYGQTEMGMVLCNHHALAHPVRIGAAGFPSPGHRVVVLDPECQEELPAGRPGILALDRSRSPMFWFPGYHGVPTQAFVGDYYLSGDTVELNDDGSISFIGRSDDVITTSGYRVGPFDVESALIEHPAVVEAAVVGKPDPERTELVKAFVVLDARHAPSRELAEALQRHVRQRLSAHAYPREVEFVEELPKTPSGKIQRFLLRNQEKAKADAAAGAPLA